MENRLFLLSPAGGGTKIVLNKQSDLILHEAEIIKPSGIEEGDIIGLLQHFEAVEIAAKAEEAARVEKDELHDKEIAETKAELAAETARATAKDAEHDAAIAAENEARTSADKAHDEEIAAIKVEEAANVATLQGNIDNEQARAEAAEKVNADAIAAEVSDRISAVSTEESDRIAGDAALQASLDAMDVAYKSADAGLQAAIDSAQAEINGILSGSTLDANSFAEIVTLINSVDTENDTEFAGYVLSNNTAVAQEVADRIAGDDKLTGDLAAEVVRATAVEAANAAAIAKEEADRIAADAALQASLDVEISGRTAADVAFQASLDGEIANRVSGDNTLTTNLNSEVLRAEAAEKVNADAIAAETLARTTKDGEQDAALAAETARAVAAEGDLDSAIAAVQSDVDANEAAADVALTDAIAKEIADRDAAISVETARATAAEGELDSAIAAEEARAIAAEGVLDTAIKAEEARAKSKDAEHDAAIAAEEARAIAAEGVLDTAIKAEEARAKSKDAEHDAAIAAEEARAIAAEGVLDAAIAAETARAKDAEKANAEAISKEESERIAAITTQKERIDIILSGSSVDLDQFSEVVKFVEDIDMNNDASLISAIDEVRKEHKSDMDAEEAARVAGDDKIIAAVGYDNRGDASNYHFEEYLAESQSFETASNDLQQSKEQFEQLEGIISQLEGDKAQAEAEGDAVAVAELEAEIKMRFSERDEVIDSIDEIKSSEVLDFEAYMPLNEVNFEAWKKDVETTELEDAKEELNDSIEKEAKSSNDRDDKIATKVGYDNRGDASNSHFEEYLAESQSFEAAHESLQQSEEQLSDLEAMISQLEGDKAQAEAEGNTDAVAQLEAEIKMRHSEKAQTKDSIDEIQGSGVLEFEAYMPLNEVNFEAWKKDVETTELKDAKEELNDSIEKEAKSSNDRDDKIIAAVGYDDRGDASESHFEEYLAERESFVTAHESLHNSEEQLSDLEFIISDLQDNKAQAEAAGDAVAVAELEAEIKMRYSERAQTEDSINEIQNSGVFDFEAYMPVNEVNFEAWKKDVETTELKDAKEELNDSIKKEADASVDRDSEIIAAIGYDDRGDASNSHFEEYLAESQSFEAASKDLQKSEEQLSDLEGIISDLQDNKAQAEAAGDTDAVAELETEIKMRYSERAQTEDSINEIQNSGVFDFEAYMPVNEVNFEAWKKDTKDAETGENFAKLNKDLEDEIKRATDAEGELTVKVADIIGNTDVSKIDSFVEVINEFNKVSEANFDSIYAKKVAITFDGDDEATLANPVKPESLQVYINGLMVELGDDYTEQVVDGAVSTVQFTGDALELVAAGAKLGAYGVHGSFSSVEFNGIDYNALIADKQAEMEVITSALAELESKESDQREESENLIAKLESEISGAKEAGDADAEAALVTELEAVKADNDERIDAFNHAKKQMKGDLANANSELAQIVEEQAAAGGAGEA